MHVNLFRESKAGIRWMALIFQELFRLQLATTLGLVGASTAARCTNLLASFLPLKVILLAGSPGVPRYFFFIDPGQKLGWIIGLSIGAVLAYAATLQLESLANRLAQRCSAYVVARANELAAIRKQLEQAQSYFGLISGVASGSLFTLACLLLLAYINPLLFSSILFLLLAQYFITVTLLARGDVLFPSSAQRLITERTPEYIRILATLDFFAGFLVIVVPLLFGRSTNLLVAILSILTLRLGFAALSGVIKDFLKLLRARDLVDPLIFRHEQIKERESPSEHAFRQLFSRTSRDAIAARALQEVAGGPSLVATEWVDSAVRGAYCFRVKRTVGGSSTYFMQQVFPQSRWHFLEHEDFLFSKIHRKTVKAPMVRARRRLGSFEIQICDYGNGEPVDSESWKDLGLDLDAELRCVQPPLSLIAAFNSSKPTLAGRLTAELLERLTVAADTPFELQCLEEFQSCLPEVRRRLDHVPLFIYNPDLKPANTVLTQTGARIMTWGRWSLEPIGFALPKGWNVHWLRRMLRTAQQIRTTEASHLTMADLRLAYRCGCLEKAIVRMRYKEALEIAGKILINSELTDGEATMIEEADDALEAEGAQV